MQKKEIKKHSGGVLITIVLLLAIGWVWYAVTPTTIILNVKNKKIGILKSSIPRGYNVTKSIKNNIATIILTQKDGEKVYKKKIALKNFSGEKKIELERIYKNPEGNRLFVGFGFALFGFLALTLVNNSNKSEEKRSARKDQVIKEQNHALETQDQQLRKYQEIGAELDAKEHELSKYKEALLKLTMKKNQSGQLAIEPIEE